MTDNETMISTNETNTETAYDKNPIMFWGFAVFYLCLALFTIIGNGLVVYAAHVNMNNNPYQWLAYVVQSLAVADMFYGLLGAPFQIYGYYLGM